MRPRPVKLEMGALPGLSLPCVVHWDLGHFVVLVSVTSRKAVIHDPAFGRRELSLLEFADHFTGIALELTPLPEFTKQSEVQRYAFSRLFGSIRGLTGSVIQVVLLGLSLQAVGLIAPFYLQLVMDEALPTSDKDLLYVLLIGFLAVAAIQALLTALRAWVTNVISSSLNFQWQSNAFEHLLKLPPPYFEKRTSADLISRFASLDHIQRTVSSQFATTVIDGVLVVSTLGVMVLYSWTLTLVACLAVVVYVGVRVALFAALRDSSSELIQFGARQQAHFLESIRSIKSIQLFGKTESRYWGWTSILARQVGAEYKISRLTVAFVTSSTLIFGVERVVIVFLAALAAIDAKFSIGMLFAFLSYKEQFSQRIAALVDRAFEWRMLRLHADRVADVMLEEAEREGDQTIAGVLSGAVEFRDVSFRYPGTDKWVVSHLNLLVPEGQAIAITGASGCGKTTLLKLLLGLLEPTSGTIFVGGVPLSKSNRAQIRRSFGAVLQDDELFSGSILDNICFFDPEVDMSAVWAVAQQASIHDDILDMPMGYRTLVGDGGVTLSGGQKQRILLARAIYAKPKVLVLDEATSHLDSVNELRVCDAVEKLSVTRIVVAHRQETIATAQRVVAMKDGSIVGDVDNSGA